MTEEADCVSRHEQTAEEMSAAVKPTGDIGRAYHEGSVVSGKERSTMKMATIRVTSTDKTMPIETTQEYALRKANTPRSIGIVARVVVRTAETNEMDKNTID